MLPSTHVHVCVRVRAWHMLLSMALSLRVACFIPPTPAPVLSLSLGWNAALLIPGTIPVRAAMYALRKAQHTLGYPPPPPLPCVNPPPTNGTSEKVLES